MHKRWIVAGVVLYGFLTLVFVPLIAWTPAQRLFESDDGAYSAGAVHLLREGIYSLDGVTPFTDREPGQSVLLAATYAVFGVENPIGVFLVQGVLFMLASFLLCRSLVSLIGVRAAGLCWVLLLTSGSALHAVFSAYRECLALVLLMGFATLWVSSRGGKHTSWMAVSMGLALGCAILTYSSFVLFPLAAAALWVYERRTVRPALIILSVCYLIVAAWGLRNFSADGRFRIVDGRRADIVWYVRGEQALHVRGIEPVRCLWSEYVSRTWEGRSPDCSFNAVKNRLEASGVDMVSAGAEGRTHILENLGSYLWFSAVDVIELHLPYVGGGWSTRFNIWMLVAQVILGCGFLAGIPTLLDRRLWLFWVLVFYNTGIFALTDATPRYFVPVCFCYAVIAAIGYHRSLQSFRL